MKYDEEEKKLNKKKLKHRPNRPGEGMRTLNEHDADSYDDFMKGEEPYDDQDLLRE